MLNFTEGCGCLLVILIAVTLVGIIIYEDYQNEPFGTIEPIKVELQRVAEHEVGSYSVDFFLNTDSKEKITVNLGRQVRIFYDVPADQPIWAMLNRAKNRKGEIFYDDGGEVHIHSGGDVSGGGWDHGKFGSGQTSTVEAQ